MQEWIEGELKAQSMSDLRLSKRLGKVLDSFSANASWAETLASYRFFDNENVNFESIVSSHNAATIEWIRQRPVVLLPPIPRS